MRGQQKALGAQSLLPVANGSKPFWLRYHRSAVVVLHLALVLLSNYLAFWLRFDGEIPPRTIDLMFSTLPILLLVRATLLFVFRLYQGLWRYTSVQDLWNILCSTLLGSFLFFILIRVILDLKAYPRSVFMMDSMILIFFLGGIRLPWRIHREWIRPTGDRQTKNVLVYGAGDAGEMIIRDMKQHPHYRLNPIGFVDDDPSKIRNSIHGVPVLGSREHLPEIMNRSPIDEVIVAIPSASPEILRSVLKCLESYHVPIKTLPNLVDILDGKVSVSQIRNLSVEDLMDRGPVELDVAPVRKLLEGKRVLVTGAGGSIGSELSRQIAQLHPAELILLDRYENSLHSILTEFNLKGVSCELHPVIGDITDQPRVSQCLESFRPEILFHAAAHKHVPLMEANPCEAVKNNISGTRILAETAIRAHVEKFVFISTDKAVNPTSVMGATKRVAESVIRILAHGSSTSFATVRFGNVLASNGSVIPLFLDQIKRGGPVTVTHPDMRRYFMLIPEAVQLVLYAAAIGSNGETFVLEMGEQIKVADMARNLIRLSGFVPELDIPIVFTGPRPGEKLFEELVSDDEIAEASSIKEILKIRSKTQINTDQFETGVLDLERAAEFGDPHLVSQYLSVLVPTFCPEVV